MSDGEHVPPTIRFRLPGVEAPTARSRSIGPVARGTDLTTNQLLDTTGNVKRHFDLSGPSRAAGQEATFEAAGDDILAVELDGGFLLYTSAGRLAQDLQRLDPQAPKDGALRLDALRQRGPASRGAADWVVQGLSVLGLDKDKIVDKAIAYAKEKLGEQAAEAVEKGATWAGTKALMWAIEHWVEPKEGLYRWSDEEGGPNPFGTAAPADFKDWQIDQPVLVFIHGAASSTLGSFGHLRDPGSAREWQALCDKFGRHIYAFEHSTFSQSPIENALALAGELPPRARLSLVTHSRGGLVGDLLCLSALDGALVDAYSRNDDRLKKADVEDRQHLLALGQLLANKDFRIERYVRVACPAQGTLLAGSHLDAFLSALLHLVGLVPYLQGSPAYAVTKRVVLQIVRNRMDARLVPGIEPLLPDSPLTGLVGQARPKEGAEIAVIAGDVEGDSLLKRIGVFLTDHVFFEDADNDLVVDTESMYGGLARDCGRYLFDQGSDVSHFRYFANRHTRGASQDWLTQGSLEDLRQFEPIQRAPKERKSRGVAGPRPVVIVVPGFMGSHLKVRERDRVWFDFADLAHGGLAKIRYGNPGIQPDDLCGVVYDDLCGALGESHDVRRFAYDWRQPLKSEAARLAAETDRALCSTDLPTRLLTHGMGGLLVRMMIARHGEVWGRLMARRNSHWVMLGTPNRGSHAMVETFLALGDAVRQLARLDPGRGIASVLDLISGFPGALELLPRPGFADTGGDSRDYYSQAVWKDLKEGNDDLWFGKNLGAIPEENLLAQARGAWCDLSEDMPNVERIAYVAGYGHPTPCGLEVDKKNRRLRTVGTLNGDGSTTHDSGRLDCLTRNDRIWYLNADHAGLASTQEAFPALVELLERGETSRLPKTRPAMRGAEQPFRYDAGPVLYPTEQSLARGLLGGRKAPRRRGRAKHALSVSCRAMDLRHACDPILVGHYEGDAISGAEAQIDRYVVGGALTVRSHLGLYAGRLGTATVVLHKPNEEQTKAGIQLGAIVIGLGELGQLTAGTLREAVRHGVLRYLLQWVDREGGRLPPSPEPREVGLATLLLGYNSTTNISVEDSVNTIVRGVLEANRQFAEAMGDRLRVGRLELIELYLDVAISAAYAVRRLPDRLGPEAEAMGFRIEAAAVLASGDGVQQRLEVTAGASYWPRLIVTSADRREDLLAPEGPTDRTRPPPKEDVGRAQGLPTDPNRTPELAQRLQFVYLSQRARAETVVQQRQPGLVETLVECSIRNTVYQPDLSRTLFQLLVPHDFKEATRQTENLVLVLDGYTANLPWEMLVADDEPLVTKTAMVRQLASARFRPRVRNTLDKTAYVVGNPSTEGYYTAYPNPKRPDANALDSLSGAEEEARAVASLLVAQGYDVVEAPAGSDGVDVINKLFRKPYRIIHISAHGVFQAGARDSARTGVVLSHGLLLTAAEIGQLEVVPDLVFLNCCFLGKADNSPAAAYNRLAYSVGRELIEMGVRAVVVAGWAVRDDAGRFFAETFYRSLLRDRRPFGRAIHEARGQTYEQFRACNTWGAFQAYGDPGFVLDPTERRIAGDGGVWNPAAPEELVSRIEQLRAVIPHRMPDAARLRKELHGILKDAPKAWQALPEVLYARGRFHADLKDFAEACRSYGVAIAVEDKKGRVPLKAVEQLANLEARQGEEEKDENRIRGAIDRLLGLVAAAGGAGGPPAPAGEAPREGQAEGSERPEENAVQSVANSERCALLGSAYKRLAGVLREWSSSAGSQEQPCGVREALGRSAGWYGRGEGTLTEPGFSPYSAHNRLVLQAVLGTARPADAQLALRAGEIGRARYATSRDYFDLVMAADGVLIARLIDGSLIASKDEKTALDAEREIVDGYFSLRDQLPESARQLDSVVTQIRLLERFFRKRANAVEPAGSDVAQRLMDVGARLERIASKLASKAASPSPAPADRRDAPVETEPASSEEPGGPSSG